MGAAGRAVCSDALSKQVLIRSDRSARHLTALNYSSVVLQLYCNLQHTPRLKETTGGEFRVYRASIRLL